MEWNCDQFEERLSDHLEGLLSPEESAAASAHAKQCAECTALAAQVSGALGIMQATASIEPPVHLQARILDATLGPRRRTESGWRRWFGADGILWQPRFAMGAVTVAASFLIVLYASRSENLSGFAALNPANAFRQVDRQAHVTYAHTAKFVNDLRLVYEIESRLEPQSDPATSVPPQQEPGPDERQPKTQDVPRLTHPDNSTAQARNLYAIVAPEEFLSSPARPTRSNP